MGLGAILGGLIGQGAGAGYDSTAGGNLTDALNAYKNIVTPTAQQLQVNLSHANDVGDLQALQGQAFQQGPSAMNNIQTDPRLAQAQMAALQQLSALGGSNGLSPGDRAAFQNIMSQSQQGAQAKSQQILQNMQARGAGGSGQELAAQLQNAQSSAQNANQAGNSLMQQAQQRALQAMSSAGSLGGQMQNQSFQQQAQQAQAQNAINQFNTQNQTQNQSQNLAYGNQAAMRNINQRQDTSNQNTGIQNQQAMYNSGAIQQNYTDQLQRAAGMANQDMGLAKYNQNQASNVANSYAGIGQGIDQGVTAYMTGGASLAADPTIKKDSAGYNLG